MPAKKTASSHPIPARTVLSRNCKSIALLIGNGINRASKGTAGISWDELMNRLVEQAALNSASPARTRGELRRLRESNNLEQKPVSLPEMFDIIEATGTRASASGSARSTDDDLQYCLITLLKQMRPSTPHTRVAQWAQKHQVPVMTTNYDHCLQDALVDPKCLQKRLRLGRTFSEFYPWDRYYSPTKLADPARGFGIWHIHGDQELPCSIRAGLDQYMGIVERLRKHKRKVAREFLLGLDEDPKQDPAYYRVPWLRIFLGKKLWIEGLGLHGDEVSLRWLLIQRFRYWKKYKPRDCHTSGWYIHGPTSIPQVGILDDQRRCFLESVGLSVIEIAAPEDMYDTLFAIPRQRPKQNRIAE
jgi:hypothetical protein